VVIDELEDHASTATGAYQIFDAGLRPMLRSEEYEMPGISVEVADTLEDLAVKIGIDPESLSKTVTDFNSSIERSTPFDPNVKDGRKAATEPVKSNWAAPIETVPFYAYGVTCGITFTFGGIKSDTHGRVLDADGKHIEGLFVAGEMLGGLFSVNYPGGAPDLLPGASLGGGRASWRRARIRCASPQNPGGATAALTRSGASRSDRD
jgi:succinate dehydrogenase/fumarate reductase flavoprotein subunit